MKEASNIPAATVFLVTITTYLFFPTFGGFVFLIGFILLILEQNNNHNYLILEISQLKEKIELLEQLKETD